MYAFPNQHNPQTGRQETGMTLRDYFAAKALQALMNDFREDLDWHAHENAKLAYEIADAMITTRGEL